MSAGWMLCSIATAGTYQGAADWRAPQRLTCFGLPEWPGGIEVKTYRDQVFGKSLDSYMFTSMDGAVGLTYFTLDYPPVKDSLIGEATALDTADWSHQTHKVKCQVHRWHKN